jgi:hypothetical protein
VQRFRIGLIVAVVGALAALALASCGDNNVTTVIQTTPAPATTATAPTTTSAKPTTSTAAPTTSTATTSTQSAQDCKNGQVYSEVSHTCITPNTDGGNPCPKGQVPAADRGTCEAKN